MRKVFGALVAVAGATVAVSQVMLCTEVRELRRKLDDAVVASSGTASDRALSEPRRNERANFAPHAGTAAAEPRAPGTTMPRASELVARLDEIEARMRANPGFESPDEMSDVGLLAHARKVLDPEAALFYYDEFLNRFPDHPEFKRSMHGAMRSAVETKNWPLVEEYADRLKRVGKLTAKDEADVLFFKALAQQQQGNLEAARSLYEKSAEVGQGLFEEANAYLTLGRMYLATNRELSRRYFTTLIERFKNKGIADELVVFAARDLASLGK